MINQPIRCKLCSNTFIGKFCNNCGEKVYSEQDKTLKHLLEDAFHFFTHFDSKFLKTVKLVLLKPGYLSQQYCAGIRKPYFKPVSLFIICIILYLLFPFFKGLNMRFETYASAEYKYSPLVAPVIKNKLANNYFSLEQLSEQYNNTSPKFAKMMMLLYLPLTALALQILFYKRKKYYFDHFIIGTEINSFFTLVGYLLIPVFVYLIIWIWPISKPFFNDDSIFYYMVTGFYFLVCAISLKRFYGEKWVWTIPKAFLFLFLFLFVIKFVYNLLLFYLVMLTL